MAKHRLLIADDFKDSADGFSRLLELHGHDVRTAYDGEGALAAAEEFRPNAAMLDLSMPGMTGYEACRRIRMQPWGREMLLLACSGWARDRERRLSAEAGFDHFFLKPIDLDKLFGLLASLRPRENASKQACEVRTGLPTSKLG